MSGRGWWTRLWAEPQARLGSWLRAMTGRRRLEDDMEAELAGHRAHLIEDLIRGGLTHEEARRQAGIAMGSALTAKEEMRGSLGLGWWDALHADLRYALRVLAKSPTFTTIAVLSLALAIGANTTIFSAAKQLLYDRLNVPSAAQLRLLAWTGDEHVIVHSSWGDWDKAADGRVIGNVFTYPIYLQLRAQNRVFRDLFAFKWNTENVTIHDEPMRAVVEMVSGNYYAQLGVLPVLGRGILPSDDAKPYAGSVAVISYGLWQRMYGGSPDVLGQTIHVNDTPLTIVGVNPRSFTGADDVQTPAEIMVPLSMQPRISPMPRHVQPILDNKLWWVNVMGRIKPGVSDATAQAALDTELSAAVRATMTVKKEDTLPRLDLRDGSRGLFEEQHTYGRPLIVLMVLAGFVLLLACANVANLMLARGAGRQREMSVRLALGAGRTRILRQMLVESLLLAAAGGACGLALGYVGHNLIPGMLQRSWEQNALQIHFDWGVLAFAAAVTMATGLLFGLAPAIAATRQDIGRGLKSATRTATRRRKGLGNKALVGFQIGLSTLLVIGAGLFLRTLVGLKSVDVGFRTDHLLLVDVNAPHPKYSLGKDIAFHKQMEAAFAGVPGVLSVAPAEMVYIADSRSVQDFTLEGQGKENDRNAGVLYNVVGNNFFPTLRIPIVAGRGFGPQDTETSVKVGVINQSLARTRFPNQNPLGKRFAISKLEANGQYGDEWIVIVGICADTRYTSLREAAPPPQFFLPYVQRDGEGGMTYMLRTAMKPDAVVPALRHAAQQIDPDIPLSNIHTQQQQIDAAMQTERTFVVLTSGFGLLALLLAAVGIYGIMAYSVSQRINEIGVRLAVGAQPRQVRRLVLRESLLLTAMGLLCGVAGVLALTRLVRSMLYGIRPDDPATVAAGVLVLLLVALAASWIPALRAARMDPMEALRHD